jgi:hypothetical protein
VAVDPDKVEHYDRERRALHVALQDWVREFENEAVVIVAWVTLELEGPNGRYLAHRAVDVNGDHPKSWEVEGPLRDALRTVDLQATSGMVSAIEEDEEDPDDD